MGLAAALLLRATAPALAFAAVGLAFVSVVFARARTLLLGAALVAAGAWLGGARLATLGESDLVRSAGSAGPVVLEVTGPARRGAFVTRIPVHVREAWHRPMSERAQLELPAGVRAPPQGAIIEAIAALRLPREKDESSGYDESAYLARRGAHVVLRADRFTVVGSRGGLPGMADRLRTRLAATIAPGLAGERRAVVAGIVLGEDEGLDQELRDRFRASGLYHLLAVSGQNVAYVVAAVLASAWIVGVPRWVAQVTALSAIVAYVAAVGWQPSVVRAGVAGGLATLAWLVARAQDRWYFALVGAGVLLAWNPYSLLDPGFQLSFAAVAAIFVLVPRLEPVLAGLPAPRWLVSVVLVSAACGLATAPIAWLHFGSIPVLSVVANALAAPVVAPILGLGLAAAAAGPLLPAVAHALAWVNGWLAAYLAWCARLVGGLPFAAVESGVVVAALAVALALGAALWGAPRAARRRLLVPVAVAAALVSVWIFWPEQPPDPPAGLRVSFLDVGQGDAVLVEVPGGAVLVDQGPPEADVAEQLRDLGVERLAAIVLTHPQRDHVGGAPTVLHELAVEAVLDPAQPVENDAGKAALAAAADERVAVTIARAGQRYDLGDLELRVLWPDGSATASDDPNDHAVVILASYGSVDVLLTADAESNVTGRLPIGPVEVVKVAHHGSADDGLAALLERLRPRVAVISVGEDNEYGHPAASTLAALRAQPGVRTFRTDVDGAVVVESRGSELTVETGA
jgi:competence protein ComEC